MYKCINCEKEVELDIKTAKRIICPYCGHRIFKKTRAKVVKRVQAK
jgi:DNA-directed RNA polymerase subunit RPC12/RpoP